MNRSTPTRGRTWPTIAATIGLVAILTVLAAAALGRTGDDSPTPPPSASPTVPPSGQPSAPPTATPTPPPSANPGSGIKLDIATGHNVVVLIDDQTGGLVDARSGRAGDGMSVRWFDAKVENVDDTTLRLTWVGLPFDDDVKMTIERDGDDLAIKIVQIGPPIESDAVGFDRVLTLAFDSAVSADDVDVSLESSSR